MSASSRTLPVRILGLATGALLATAAVLHTSNAAFTATTKNGSNSFAAGTVVLTDDDLAAVMFNLPNMAPGNSAQKCIVVTYTGTHFPVNAVKLYGKLDSNTNAMADYLKVTVEQGTGGTFNDCTGFTASSTLVPATTLTAFTTAHTNYTNGVTSYTPTSGSTTMVYRFTAQLDPATPDSVQGGTTTATFTWEVQS